MTVVNQQALNRARRRVWGLFGVGDAYQATESGVPEARTGYVPIGGLSIEGLSTGGPVDDTVGTGTPTGTGGGFDPFNLPPAR